MLILLQEKKNNTSLEEKICANIVQDQVYDNLFSLFSHESNPRIIFFSIIPDA